MTDALANSDPIDRLSPARCPKSHPVMYQKWRSLLFLHWALPPDEIRPLLPSGLDLDLFAGDGYVGLILFTMHGIRPAWLPAVPWFSSFHETNVRTYVHKDGRDPGVWFFSLDAANSLAAVLARSLFHLSYHRARMSLCSKEGTDPVSKSCQNLSYRSERLWPGPLPATSAVDARISSPALVPPAVGSLDHFLIERYLLYTTHRGRLIRAQVHHKPYPIQNAEISALDESLIAAAGLIRPNRPPLVHFSEGVDAKIFSPIFLVES